MGEITKEIKKAAIEYNIEPGRVLGTKKKVQTARDIRVTAARWRVIYNVLNVQNPPAYSHVGYYLKIDHTTVMNAYKKMKATEGRYFDDKIKNLNKKTKEVHKIRDRDYKESLQAARSLP